MEMENREERISKEGLYYLAPATKGIRTPNRRKH